MIERLGSPCWTIESAWGSDRDYEPHYLSADLAWADACAEATAGASATPTRPARVSRRHSFCFVPCCDVCHRGLGEFADEITHLDFSDALALEARCGGLCQLSQPGVALGSAAMPTGELRPSSATASSDTPGGVHPIPPGQLTMFDSVEDLW